MAVAPPAEFSTDGGAVLVLDEEIDGEEMGSRNYRFSKIGESIQMKSGCTTEFEPQFLPSQPLTVSELFRLLFVAHPQGFYVARTKDVMASAEEIKEKKTGPSMQELSLVDVPTGNVSILALSADDSLLAAAVSNQVHFFAVSALLHKEQKPSYSVSLDDSICIKDVHWDKKITKAYFILSSNGKLFHGSGQGPLTCVMEGVDSADWSIKGNFLAVARRNVVIILSSRFEEKLRFLLSFQSAIRDSDANPVIRVDSIRWIRPDSIAVGCFQLNDDGEEENYIVEIITSRGRRITDAKETLNPMVLSFNNVFLDFCSDAVPTRSGPHLLTSYLDHYGLAFVANRNLSSQVALFCWQGSGKSEAAMVEILDDAWTLHIDSQDNGDENVIVGLSVDKVSYNENIRFTMGDEEREVSPCCVIICLTIDGKISVFHFASAADAIASPEGCASSEEDDAPLASVKHKRSEISSSGANESGEPTSSASQPHELGISEVVKTSNKVTTRKDLSSSNVDIRLQEENAPENMGQKSFINTETLKVDYPEKALSVELNQDDNAGNQSTSIVKHSEGSFLGRIAGDVSHQLVSNNQQLRSNVEQLHKVVPPANILSEWALARSNARDGASKTSDGRHSSLTYDEIDNIDKHTLQLPGGVQQHQKDLKEKPSVNFTSPGQTVLTAQRNRNSQLAHVGSQVPSGNSFASRGKFFKPDFKKDLEAVSPSISVTQFGQNASKQFGNVEEMTKKLDILLEGIEGKGGYRDACLISQKKSVIELEEGIWALSDRCRTQRGLMNEQQRELQFLLDKMVEVLARKVYMEGIFKQATDSKYWELWNRQKLSSELELKRRRILDLNQELTGKLIELERHFNSLEFNKFRENEETQRNRRAQQNLHGPSRQIQSLRSLHNTMTAQLAAAEQLSGCLSRQMAALSIESSEKHDVKRQLFESIGLTCFGDTGISPTRNRISDTSANKDCLITSGSIAAKGQSSLAKEPETARHRRDSFDLSWASFYPPQTTLRRMRTVDNENGSSNRSLLNISKQYLSPQLQKKSEVAHAPLSSTSRTSENHYKSKGYAEASAEQFPESASAYMYHRTAGYQDHGGQMSPERSFSPMSPPSMLETRTAQKSALGAFRLADEKSKSSLPFPGKSHSFGASESKAVQQSNTGFLPLPSMPAELPEQSPTLPSDSTETFDRFKIGFTNSTPLDQKNNALVSEAPLFDAKIPVTHVPAFSSGHNVSEKGPLSKNSEKTSRTNTGMSASSPLQSALGSSLLSSNNYLSPTSLVSKPNSSTVFPVTPKTSETNVVVMQEGSQPQPLVTSVMNFPSTLPFFNGSSFSRMSSSSSSVKSESLTMLSQPSVAMHGSKTEGMPVIETKVNNVPSNTEMSSSALQPELPISTSDLKFGHMALPALTELSTISKSENQDDIGGSSKKVETPTMTKAAPTMTEAAPTVAISSEGTNDTLKSVVSNSSQEEEMEEEAPETDQSTELAFTNLGGFGLGPTQNSTPPTANPFGVGMLNKNTASVISPYTMSASSGELFRPASFNFQSPQASPEYLQAASVNFSSGFSSGFPGQVSAAAGFGQPAQIGAGQQALGSVLGTFGQSRQIGTSLSGSNAAAPASGFTSGFAGGFGGGFATAPSSGGFASLAAGGGGFGAAAISGGGFGAAAAAGGFGAAAAAGGFAAAATAGGGFAGAGPISGGGFVAFSNQPGNGGFSAFGGGSGVGRPPSELFTQMRK